MSMTRSDLPHVGKLPPEVQRQAVDEMWRAYAKAEKHVLNDELRAKLVCPLSHVATMTEMLEAALAVIG